MLSAACSTTKRTILAASHTRQLLISKLYLSFCLCQLLHRNLKTRSFGNRYDGISIFCCTQLLLKTRICLDGFPESFELLF